MKLYAALRREDIGRLYRVKYSEQSKHSDLNVFAKRMQEDRTFAEIHSGDKRVRQLQR